MQNPIAAYAEWFKGLARDIQGTIGLGVAVALPPDARTDPDDTPHDEWMIGFLARHASTGTESTWILLVIIGMTDMAFNGRSTKQEWETNAMLRAEFSDFAEEKVGNKSLASKLRQPVDPELEAQWISSASEWNALKADKLAPAALSKWMGSGRPQWG